MQLESGSHPLPELSCLIQELPCIAWTTHPDGTFDELNDRFRLSTTASEASTTLDQFLSAVSAEDHPSFLKTWKEKIAAGREFEIRFRFRRKSKDGCDWHLARVAPRYDSANNLLGWLAIAQEIEEQVKVEETLRKTEARLEAVVENLPIGVVILDQDQNPIQWNAKFSELRGLKIDASNWLTPLHPDDRATVIQSWEAAVKEAKPWSGIYRLVHPDGSVVWVSGRAKPVQLGSEGLEFIRTTEDVTAIKVVEEELTKTNRELNDLAHRLDAEVQQRTEKLREALAELDKLSYSIVHDMRAPLRTIIGFSEILLEDHAAQLDDTAKDLLHRMAAAAKREDLLIENVLAYHRSVRSEFHLLPVNLDLLVNGILATYPNLQPPRVKIEVQRPLGWVIAHETLLTQCVSALLNNASKFVPPKVIPEVLVRTEKTHNRIRLWVEDNGIGIAPEHHARIFNIFEVLNKEVYPGTGIGLPLAKKAVERMNGAIGVESAPGKGARFWIELPHLRTHESDRALA